MSEQAIVPLACGCRLLVGQGMAEIDYCPLHKAAPELLKTLKHTQAILHGYVCQQEADCVEACDNARAIIREVEAKIISQKEGRKAKMRR